MRLGVHYRFRLPIVTMVCKLEYIEDDIGRSRRCEIVGLKLAKIDFDNQRLSVKNSKAVGKNVNRLVALCVL